MIAATVGSIILGILAWIPLRHEPYLGTARSFSLQILLSLGGLLILLSLSVRWIPSFHMTCTGTAVALILGYSFSGTAYFVRAFVLLAQATYAKVAQDIKLDVQDFDEVASIKSGESTTTALSKTAQSVSLLTVCLRLVMGQDLFQLQQFSSPKLSTSSPDYRKNIQSNGTNNETNNNKSSIYHETATGTTSSLAARLNVLSQLHLVVTPQMIIMNALLCGLPGIIGIIILVSVDSLYTSSCTCPSILLDGAIIALAFVMIYSWLSMRILWLCRNVQESYGVLKELLFSAGGCGIVMIIGWALIIADPQDLSLTMGVPWEWFVLVGGFYFHFVWVWVSIFFAWRQKVLDDELKRRGSRLDSSATLPDQMNDFLVQNPDEDVQKAFENYAARRFSVEGYRFIMDVTSFRRVVEHKSNVKPTINWIKSKIKLLFNTYLVRESPMELNISDKLLNEMTLKLQKCETTNTWPVDFFDPVYHEMWHFILYNLWYGFVTSGELAQVLENADAGSKRGSKRISKKTSKNSLEVVAMGN
jgi:hypothetical protein